MYWFYIFFLVFCLSSPFGAVTVLKCSTLGVVSGSEADVDRNIKGWESKVKVTFHIIGKNWKKIKEKLEFLRKTRF